MTNNEKRQPKRVFFQAGQHAWALRIPFGNNPYTLEPYRTQWIKGWRFAQKQHNNKRFVPRAKNVQR